MLHEEVDKMIEYANELLAAAEHESERSEEDVVTHLICVNSRQSIANYFAGFLIKQGIEPTKPVTLQGLLDQCKEVDALFDQVDLQPIHCRCDSNDEAYCMGMDQVSECLSIAQHARSIVMKDTPRF
jgi:HEPN domain-containing protein